MTRRLGPLSRWLQARTLNGLTPGPRDVTVERLGFAHRPAGVAVMTETPPQPGLEAVFDVDARLGPLEDHRITSYRVT